MQKIIEQKGIFITGTDTGVGKTFLTTQLIGALRQQGLKISPRKPVESGCQRNANGQLLPEDGDRLFKAAETDSLNVITPFRYEAALSPPRAAALENQSIHLRDLSASCQSANHPLLVEGAGGFLSPIADDGLNADLASELGLPVLIVAPDRLGCINHCLLTCEAIERRGLKIVAIVLNQIEMKIDPDLQNASELQRLTPYPVFASPYQASTQDLEYLALMIIEQGLI